MNNEPIWNAENMNRKQGDTTFKTCGWCSYVGCGSCRYNCHLDSECDLMKSYGDEKDVKWDTECRILNLGKIDILDIVESKKREVKDCYSQIKDLNEQIDVLLKDKRIPREEKPALPDSRDADYFKLKSVVWVFHDEKWNRGIVVSGYRSGDGCVSYVLDNYSDSAKGWGCGLSAPCILADWEYRYFKKNPDEYRKYLLLCDKKYNGEKMPMEKYFQVLTTKN